METIDNVFDKEEKLIVVPAYYFALAAHAGQARKGNKEPYIHHPVRVANLLVKYSVVDLEAYISALLHDVVEDTHINNYHIRKYFGSDVSLIVAHLTKGEDESAARYNYRLSLAPTTVHNIKCCDIMDNMDGLMEAMGRDKGMKYAESKLEQLESLQKADDGLYQAAKNKVVYVLAGG